MQNVGLDELQAINKIAGRNINNLRYANDTTVITESEEKLKNPLMRVKEGTAHLIIVGYSKLIIASLNVGLTLRDFQTQRSI